MKKIFHQLPMTLLVTLLALFFSGCASVQYDKLNLVTDSDNTKRWEVEKKYGIPFYEAKPYILVQYSTDENGTRNAMPTIITLPDKSKPYKARVEGLFGSASVSMTLSNGALVSTEANFKTDDTLAGLMGAIGTAVKIPSEVKGLEAAAKVATAGIPKTFGPTDCSAKASGDLWKLMGEAKQLVEKFSTSNETPTQQSMKGDILVDMDSWRESICKDPEANFATPGPNELKRILSFQSSIEKFQRSASVINKKIVKYIKFMGCDQANQEACLHLVKAKAHVESVMAQIDKYLPGQPELPHFELYEIQYDDEGILKGLKKIFPVTE